MSKQQKTLFRTRSGGDRDARIDRYVSALLKLRAETRNTLKHINSSEFAQSHKIGKSFLLVCSNLNILERERKGKRIFYRWVWQGIVNRVLGEAVLNELSRRTRKGQPDCGAMRHRVKSLLNVSVSSKELSELLPGSSGLFEIHKMLSDLKKSLHLISALCDAEMKNIERFIDEKKSS